MSIGPCLDLANDRSLTPCRIQSFCYFSEHFFALELVEDLVSQADKAVILRATYPTSHPATRIRIGDWICSADEPRRRHRDAIGVARHEVLGGERLGKPPRRRHVEAQLVRRALGLLRAVLGEVLDA